MRLGPPDECRLDFRKPLACLGIDVFCPLCARWSVAGLMEGDAMDGFGRGRLRQQVRLLQRQYLQGGGLPFTDVLSEQAITEALSTIEGAWNDRVYTPLVTLCVFLGQVLCTDHLCRAAVARLLAHRLAHGQSACSSRTGAYCQARQRLPESFFSTTARHVGRA